MCCFVRDYETLMSSTLAYSLSVDLQSSSLAFTYKVMPYFVGPLELHDDSFHPLAYIV